MGIQTSTQRIEDVKRSDSTWSETTASSPPSSPLEIEVEHLETFILVWLDEYTHDDEKIETLKKRLRQHVTVLVPFQESKSCEKWLKSRPADEKILLIVSGGFAKRIVSLVHHLPSILAIYVFCGQLEKHAEWTPNYSKIRGVIPKAHALVEQISKDQIGFENIEDSKAMKIFKNRPHTRIFDLENTSFIWYQLFLEILISPSYFSSSASAAQLIEILRQSTSIEREGRNLIDEFEKTYRKDQAVSWLTDNTPLARFLNKALREENISMLFYLRFFLIDIYNQLISQQLPSAHVYRKQIMSRTEIEKIRNNGNNYLMLNQFLHTSTKAPQSLSADTNETPFETVLIEIRAEHRDGTAPFAYVPKSADEDHSAVLFMCGALFKIVSLTQNDDSTWLLQLSLAGHEELDLLMEKKQKLRENKDLLIIVELLDQCNQSDKANIYCQQLLRQFSSNHPLVHQIQQKMNISPAIQSVSLTRSQFILIDLSKRLGPLASAMLKVLQCLTDHSIWICNNPSEIDLHRMQNKTLFIFTSSQIYSSMKKETEQPTQFFILDDNENQANEAGHFFNSEDLIFQLADELYRCYQWEVNDHGRSGDTSLAAQKEQLAKRIHQELKKVHRELLTTDESDISTRTTLIWLKCKNNENNNLIHETQNRFKPILSSVFIFDDADDCYNHVCTTEYNHSVFLIIDSEYQNISVAGFPTLPYVKQIYTHEHTSSSQPVNQPTHNYLCSRLICDLISHYNQLGNQFQEKNDSKNAKDMFYKAQQLCDFLPFYFEKN